MRTKALILTAAIAVAGIANSVAQVYSVNVVGYVNKDLVAGFNLICNPLNNTAGNQLSKILALPDGAIGAIVYRYSGGAFQDSLYVGGGTWLNDFTLAPGEVFFISMPATGTVTFVGEVTQNADSNMQVAAGWSIVGSKVPQSAKLDTIAFPAGVGDTIYFYRGGQYVDSTYIGGGTWLGTDPNPTPAVGEAFWANLAAAGNWTRDFVVQ